MVEEIINRIKDDDLINDCRQRNKVHKRWYFYFVLKSYGLTLKQIGTIFHKNHATIIHGIRQYKYFTESNDKQLKKDIIEYDNLFQINQ